MLENGRIAEVCSYFDVKSSVGAEARHLSTYTISSSISIPESNAVQSANA
jgi:hypothetical protein